MSMEMRNDGTVQILRNGVYANQIELVKKLWEYLDALGLGKGYEVEEDLLHYGICGTIINVAENLKSCCSIREAADSVEEFGEIGHANFSRMICKEFK